MKYLPFEHLIYKTDLSEKEAIKRLSDYIETKKSGFKFNRTSTKEYEGFIDGNSFGINRIIKNRNSFLPQITGTIQSNTYETQIEIKMKLSWFVLIFMIFWCVFVMLFLVVFLVTAFTQDGKISVDIFIPVFMLAFAYLLTMFGFKSESKKSKEDLKKIFEVK